MILTRVTYTQGAVVFLAGIAVNSAILASLIAGVFLLLNTILTVWANRRFGQREPENRNSHR